MVQDGISSNKPGVVTNTAVTLVSEMANIEQVGFFMQCMACCQAGSMQCYCTAVHWTVQTICECVVL